MYCKLTWRHSQSSNERDKVDATKPMKHYVTTGIQERCSQKQRA